MLSGHSGFRYVISGQVQGVGFRHFIYTEARLRGIAGYIKNLGNGDVEAVVSGPDEDLRRIEAAIRRGPPGAHVTNLQRTPYEDADLAAASFEIRF